MSDNNQNPLNVSVIMHNTQFLADTVLKYVISHLNTQKTIKKGSFPLEERNAFTRNLDLKIGDVLSELEPSELYVITAEINDLHRVTHTGSQKFAVNPNRTADTVTIVVEYNPKD